MGLEFRAKGFIRVKQLVHLALVHNPDVISRSATLNGRERKINICSYRELYLGGRGYKNFVIYSLHALISLLYGHMVCLFIYLSASVPFLSLIHLYKYFFSFSYLSYSLLLLATLISIFLSYSLSLNHLYISVPLLSSLSSLSHYRKAPKTRQAVGVPQTSRSCPTESKTRRRLR